MLDWCRDILQKKANNIRFLHRLKSHTAYGVAKIRFSPNTCCNASVCPRVYTITSLNVGRLSQNCNMVIAEYNIYIIEIYHGYKYKIKAKIFFKQKQI